MEFALKDTRLALTLVGVSIAPPAVPAGTVCQERRVFPAECRGLRSTYRGRITVSARAPHTRVPVPVGSRTRVSLSDPAHACPCPGPVL